MNPPQTGVRYSQSMQIWLLIIITVSVTGYFIGLRNTPEPVRQAPAAKHTDRTEVTAPQALSYSEMSAESLGPNRDWKSSLSKLSAPKAVDRPESQPSPTQLLAALKLRSERRAFDGAPPTVPHPVDERGNQSCLLCHGAGLKIGNQFAAKISHAHLSQCTQCHVSASLKWAGVAADSGIVDSEFVALAPTMRGKRAYPSAPPTIPHSTWMRVDCLSCHGPSGLAPLQTTHPSRQSCTQCHVPDAEFERLPFLSSR